MSPDLSSPPPHRAPGPHPAAHRTAAASHTGKVVATTDGDTIKVRPTNQPRRNYYYYNADQKLANAIREGYSGAYWEKLRRPVRAR